ncbi:MAG: hypothetical protein ACFHWX_23215 [Bacteroidota bacterium]
MIALRKTYCTISLEWYLILNTVIITSFLGFIDEGFYNFNWIFDVVAIVALTLYGLAIYTIQFLLFKMLLGNYPVIGKSFSIIVSADLIV